MEKQVLFLNRSLKDGDNLTVSAPEGNFTLKKAGYAGGHLVLFAAGSGITPILSLLAEAQESHPAAKKTLIFGNSNAATTMLAEQVNQLAQAENITVAHVHTAAGSQDTLHTGRIDFSKTLQLMHEYGGKDAEQVYICGPSDMMQSVQNAVKDLGIADSKIQVEYFSTPVEDATPAASQPAPSAGPVQAKVKVTLDDEEFEFDLHTDGLVILDAALDQGIDAPFSCKGGICTSCRAIVKEGTVKMNKNFALTDEELEEGYVLTCQSHPTSPVVHIDYDDA